MHFNIAWIIQHVVQFCTLLFFTILFQHDVFTDQVKSPCSAEPRFPYKWGFTGGFSFL